MPDKSDLPDKSNSFRPLAHSAALLASIVDQLACPACLSGLVMEESRLICRGCCRVFPIVDGIPVLIAEGLSGSNLE
jgi:uncharacterized protein